MPVELRISTQSLNAKKVILFYLKIVVKVPGIKKKKERFFSGYLGSFSFLINNNVGKNRVEVSSKERIIAFNQESLGK